MVTIQRILDIQLPERQVIGKASKFYLLDVGVAGTLVKRRIQEAKGEPFGNAFERFVFMEIQAHSSYSDLNDDINFWRTKSGLEAEAEAVRIKETAALLGMACETTVVVGRFGVEMLKLARDYRPVLITLTRSKRPAWVRRFFGSPVDSIIENAGCRVVEDYRDDETPACTDARR